MILKNKIYLTAFTVLLLSANILFQADFLDARYGERQINPECPWCEETEGEDVIFLPITPSVMSLFAPADPHFLADLLWMRTSYYFGSHALSDGEYPYLLHLLDLITDLSPEWVNIYLFGAVILPTEAESAEDGFYIIDKGLAYHPDTWELWFFKGYFLWKVRGDTIAAAQALLKASILPGAPVYLANLSATLATREGQRELGIRFLQQALENVRDPAQRKILLRKMKEMRENNG